MRNRPSATHKRKYASFADTITSSIEAPDHTSKPASEDSRSAKRRSAQPQAESLAPSPVCIPTSPTMTPPQAHGSHISPFRVSNDTNADDVDGGGKDDGADTSDLSRSDLLDLQSGGNSEHHKGVIDKELLHSLRQSVSPSERREGDQDFSPDSEKGEEKSDASNGAVEDSHDDELNQADEAFCRASGTNSQRRKPSNRPVRKKGRNPSKDTATSIVAPITTLV